MSMSLSLSLPASPDELVRYAEAARLLGCDRVDHDDVGRRLVTDLAGTSVAAPPPVPAPAVAAEPVPVAEPVRAVNRAATPKPPAPKPGGAAPHSAGGVLLDLLRQGGGRWEGNAAGLAAAAGCTPAAARQAVRKMEAKGKITRRSIGAATGAGARFIITLGSEPRPALAPVPQPEPEPERPVMPDVGPMERRRFDPDTARAGAAGAL